MSNRTLLLLMGFVAFLIVAVGVGGVIALSASGGDDGDTQASNGSATSTPRSGSTGSNGGKICEGKTLIVPGDEPTTQLDPIQVGDVSTSEYVVEIFGGLVTLDPQLQIQPDLAKSWDISPDGKVYTFKLRDNVVFHNNRRVTAQDFKDSVERAADPANASPTVKAYLGDIVGVKDKFDGRAKEVSGVKVIDQTTIQITLSEPADYFLAELTYPVAYVTDKEQIDKDPRNWTRKPNGTGPFKVAEFTPSERIRLVRNDRYHLGAPKLEEVDFELGGGSLAARYENNEIHIGGVSAIELDAVKSGKSPLSKDYRPTNELAVGYISLNSTKAPFDDPKVRQAFAMTIDRESINNVLFYGAYRVADGITPPEMPGYTESVKSLPYDVTRAKQLLQESKYAGKLPKVTLIYGGVGGNDPDTLVAIQKGWQDALGVEIQLQAIDPAAYLREERRGNFQMISAGWSADYPDIEDFLGKLFASDSTLNHSQYKNPQVDQLLQQARRETDKTKRYATYAQAEQLILDDVPIIPTFWPVNHKLVKSCVKDYPDVSMTVPKYRYVDIDNKGN